MKILLAFSLMSLVGCDAFLGKVKALGSAATVVCYSAEKVIYSGKSTGKVVSPETSDGYQFMDAATNKLVEVSGNCIVSY